MLVVRNLSFQYPESAQPLFRDISFTATKGEMIVVVGLNGCGKTTLARMLGGLLPVQSGELLLHSRPIAELHGEARPISLLQRFDELFLATQVDREIAINFELAALSSDEISRRVAEQAERFKVSHLLAHPCQTLSPGERLRVALAAQLSQSSPLVVIDEADAFLDQPGRELLSDVTMSLASSGSIVIRVTHDLASVDKKERILLMCDGTLCKCSDMSQVRAKLLSGNESGFADVNFSDHANAQSQSNSKGITQISVTESVFSPGSEMQVGPFSLELEGNSWTGLSGANGSGKTLMGKYLAGLFPTKSGNLSIRLSNQSPGTGSSLLPDPALIGYLPPEPERFFFAATVSDCFKDVAERKSLLFWPRLLEFDTTYYASRDPLSLSGGEQRRLAILIALQHDPAFLILDEPTANLDITGREKVVLLMKIWKTLGRGGLLISHDYELLQSHCDRLLTLR